MPVSIKLVDFDTDKSVLIDLLKRNRKLSASYPYSARYDWLYLNNPHGLATGWKVVDDESHEVVGFTVALPREMSVQGKRVIAWNCADFSIDTKYRTLGVAAKLRRAARNAVDAGQYPFLYAHPNERMLAVHKRVGHTVIGHMRRYASVLDVGEKIKSVSGGGTAGVMISKPISVLTNRVLDWRDGYRLSKRRYEIEIHPHFRYADEFTEFYGRIEMNYPVWGVRDATYLNWRYNSNPIYQVETITAHTQGKLAGYLIYMIKDQSVHIKDLVVSSPETIQELISSMARHLRTHSNCASISFAVFELNSYIPVLKRLGFRERSDSKSALVVHASPSYELKSSVLNPSFWFMTVGDRDE